MNPQLSATTLKGIRNPPHGLGRWSFRNYPQPQDRGVASGE